MKLSSNKRFNPKTVAIPKEVFEKLYLYKNGGVKELELAGRYQTEMKGETNAELEGGEWIIDSQGLRQVEGKSHARGGVDLNLEGGTMILSNYSKIGSELSKQLSKEYDVKIGAKDTYAKALEKVYNKIGLGKLNEEHASLIKKLDKQADTKDETTLEKNAEYLSNKLHEKEQEKAPLEEQAMGVFNTLFESQESKKNKNNTDEFQLGGTFTASPILDAMANLVLVAENSNGSKAYRNIKTGEIITTPATKDGTLPTVDRQAAPTQTVQTNVGTNSEPVNNTPTQVVNTTTPQTTSNTQRSLYQHPGQVYQNRIGNAYELNSYAYQPNVNGQYGEVDKIKAMQEEARLFPGLYSEYFKEGSNGPTDAKAFQSAKQSYYYGLLDSAKRLYGEDSEQYKQLAQQIDIDSFVGDSSNTVRGFDGKYGNWTSTRPNFSLEVLPEDIYKQMQSEGINTFGQLEAKYPDIYNEYIGSKELGAPSDAWLGPIRGNNTSPTTETPTEEQPTVEGGVLQPQNSEQMNMANTGVLARPDMSQLPPTSQQGHLKTNRRYERADFVGIDPQAQLNELALMTSRANDSLDLMPAHQRAAVQANMFGTQTQQASQIMQQAQAYNNQLFNQIQNQNNQIQMAEENAGAQDALNYEQRQYLAQAKTDNEYRDYFNAMQLQNHQNFIDVQNANKMNHLFRDFQLTDRGYESVGPKYYFTYNGQPLQNTQEEAVRGIIDPKDNRAKKSTKKKFGGRFGK